MTQLVESIRRELGSFGRLSVFTSNRSKDGRSMTSLISSVNYQQDDNDEDETNRPVNIDLLHQIASNSGLKIIRVHPNYNGVLFKENKFVLDSLHWHNTLRIKHRVPPLSLSIQLCQQAQEWANILAHRDVFYHRNQQGIGENLLLKCSSIAEIEVNGEQATKYWYGEMDSYRFDLSPELLHTHANQFSQMIWKSSRKFGIGKARSRSGKVIVVAAYEPAGNVRDLFYCNVFPPFQDSDHDNLSDYNGTPKAQITRVLGQSLKNRRKAISDIE